MYIIRKEIDGFFSFIFSFLVSIYPTHPIKQDGTYKVNF